MHDVTKRDHRNIGASPHPAALGGIEREPEIANQDLALIAMTSLLIAFPVPEMAAPAIAYGILR
jgi:hypothetical protein